MRTTLAIATLLLACGAHANEAAFDALVAAERAFAADAQARGVNPAFVEAAGADGVVFRTGAVRASVLYGNAPPAQYALAWGPAAAEIAGSGDLGYTGPYTMTPGNGEPPNHGHYFTVWRRDGEGPFRFHSDIGVTHAQVPAATEVLRRGPPVDATAKASRGERDARLQALREIDSGLVARLRRQSPAAVYTAVGAEDLVVLRDGSLPMGRPFADSPFANVDLGKAKHFTATERISRDGTLASTYGLAAEGRGPIWMRVWRHDASGWKLAVDAMLPAPPLPDAIDG
jgi:hypothetical protein